MQQELMAEFEIPAKKVSVIPFGINNTVPNTSLTTLEAKRKFGLAPQQKTLLFFGNIAPYKGLEHLVAAFSDLVQRGLDYRLIIAGRTKGSDEYWAMIQQAIARQSLGELIIRRIEYIPDELVEEYFKAADVLVLPYTHIFQSGVLFLAYSFGLPVIASDVGSMKDDIIEGRTGYVCQARDDTSLARTIERYFDSKLFANLENLRSDIQDFANDRYSWDKVGEITKRVYGELVES
jgi:glycosyltransferase involved in cell wall biosynthesis